MKNSIISLLFLFAFGVLQLHAQVEDPVSWKFKVNELQNGEAELVFNARIDADWHLYSMYFDDGGPVRLTIHYKESNKFELLGKAIEKPKPHSELDEIFGINVAYFDKKGQIIQKIKINSDEDFTIKGELEYQVCYEDKCVLFTPEFKFSVKGQSNAKTTTGDKEKKKKLKKKKVIKKSRHRSISTD